MRAIVLQSMALYALLSADAGTNYVTTTATLSWDPVTTDVNGGPDVVAYYRAALFNRNADPRLVPPLVSAAVDGTKTSQALATMLASVPNGTEIDARVLAVDAAGNASEWSDPVAATVDKVSPSKPGGCRLLK